MEYSETEKLITTNNASVDSEISTGEARNSSKNGDINVRSNVLDSVIFIDDSAVDVCEADQAFEHVNTEVSDELEDNDKSNSSKDPFESTSSDTAKSDTPNKTTIKSSSVPEKNQNAHQKINLIQVTNETAEGDPPNIPENTYYCTIQTVEAKYTCMKCLKIKTVKYCCNYNEEKTYLCDDDCLCKLQQSGERVIVREYFTKFYCPVQVDSNFKFTRQCYQCCATLKNVTGICSWEAMDFCKEQCLFRYQRRYGKSCTECNKPVAFNQLGKYAVRFGCIIRQFCSSSCLETRKKKIKICSYCQKSINRTKTMMGNKYFCHDICKGMFEFLQKPRRPPFLLNPDDARCYVCRSMKPMLIEFDYHYSSFYFCSSGCFTIFKFVQNCEPPKKCHTCSKYVLQQYLENNGLYYDNFIHYFCSKTCQHIYIITHRRVVPCIWCKVKKYNFDMIQKNNFLESTVFTCSIYCLSQLKVSVDAVVSTERPCIICGEMGLYELKFSSGIYMFCSNHCISIYQTQIMATSPAKRTRGRTRQILPDKPGPLPVITSVCSLATNQKLSASGEGHIRKIVVIKSPELPEQKNVSTSVQPLKADKECQQEIEYCTAEIQTDVLENGMNINPILVPIYVPSPMHGWQAPVPVPIPFPLVIPAPILIPLTKKTAAGVMKEFKKVQVKAPTDPFEAELLMMAELVAAEKKDEATEVESEEDAPAEEAYSPEPTDTSNTFGDDMLQMALKMATDFDEPPVDLEGALTASTITPSQVNEVVAPDVEDVDDPEQVQSILGRPSGRGKKKVVRQTRQNPGRRGRRPAHMDITVMPPDEPPPPPMEPVEKPDANMCLKYTFGVNAWKQWITTKNADLERSSRRLKLFNTELLQLTSDELNYSLCLFVDEVKKPNGSDYAPDTIYYLCLGIQQYLYENGRIDNIFCDSYYDKFTDCLDEVCKKFTALYNDSHYIVTRVEEEHLWESKQLGAHSPHVLLSTLMFFNTKHFNLTNVEEHMQLSFSHIMKHWKRNPNQPGVPKQPGSRNVLLRFYPPQSSLDGNARKKRVYEQQENEENPLRCPVKLYEFYLSKCPESVKTRNDVFYLLPERSCVPDSPVWYSTMALDCMALEKMLNRVKIVKEINVALLTN